MREKTCSPGTGSTRPASTSAMRWRISLSHASPRSDVARTAPRRGSRGLSNVRRSAAGARGSAATDKARLLQCFVGRRCGPRAIHVSRIRPRRSHGRAARNRPTPGEVRVGRLALLPESKARTHSGVRQMALRDLSTVRSSRAKRSSFGRRGRNQADSSARAVQVVLRRPSVSPTGCIPAGSAERVTSREWNRSPALNNTCSHICRRSRLARGQACEPHAEMGA